jgi:hypothetical protein
MMVMAWSRGKPGGLSPTVELTRPQFGEADESVPVTATPPADPLPEEPQALDFGSAP